MNIIIHTTNYFKGEKTTISVHKMFVENMKEAKKTGMSLMVDLYNELGADIDNYYGYEIYTENGIRLH